MENIEINVKTFYSENMLQCCKLPHHNFGGRRANRIKINEMHISVTKTIVEPKTLETPSKQNAPNLNLALLDIVAFVIVSTFTRDISVK